MTPDDPVETVIRRACAKLGCDVDHHLARYRAALARCASAERPTVDGAQRDYQFDVDRDAAWHR